MKLFIVDVSYIVPIETVDQHLLAHRDFLNKYIQLGLIVVAGKKNPRTGGMIIIKTDSLSHAQAIMSEDPFSIYKVANITITEMEPTLISEPFKGVLA